MADRVFADLQPPNHIHLEGQQTPVQVMTGVDADRAHPRQHVGKTIARHHFEHALARAVGDRMIDERLVFMPLPAGQTEPGSGGNQHGQQQQSLETSNHRLSGCRSKAGSAARSAANAGQS